MNETISWGDFSKIDMRVGTIIAVADFPEARNPSYKVKIDFGSDLGVKKSSTQISYLYTKEDLVGKQVVAVIDFPKKQIANFMSECLILGAAAEKDVVLLQPESSVPNGLKIP